MRSLDVVLSKGELEAHKVPGAAKRVAWVSEIKVGSVVSKSPAHVQPQDVPRVHTHSNFAGFHHPFLLRVDAMGSPGTARKAPRERWLTPSSILDSPRGRHRASSGPFRGKNTIRIASDHTQEDYLCHNHILSRLGCAKVDLRAAILGLCLFWSAREQSQLLSRK
jgi:hypothetical protein